MLNLMEKYKEKSKNKKLEIQPQTEYVTLTPDDTIINGDEYLNALKWAIDGKKAKNIALSGPYGSGKSSVIETFLKNNPALEKRSIKISMATFVEEALDDKGNLSKQTIKIEKDEIERSILKQLFYKVEHKKIPQSRYRKLHRISFWKVFLIAMVLLCASLLVGYVFWPSSLASVVDKIIIAGSTVKLPKCISLIAASIFIIGCMAGLSSVYRIIFSKFKVKEIKLPKDVTIQRTAENQDTIFNKNMDEIMYFFEETKYNIVFFEDFDRLNNTSIFVHLRELNIILNNYDAIKDPIVFVYAVKDDVFTDADRTKFFDFIIPVVPIINSTNSGEILLKKLDESKKIKKEHNISESFVLDVSPYIADMRILQNIYNEFVVYKNTLTTGQNLKLLDEPMLALIIFKNLYPRDFADLQMECGIVKQAFKDKGKFISTKRNELQKRVNESAEVLENIKTETFRTIKSLKYSFLCEITDGTGCAYRFAPGSGSYVNATTFLNDSYVVPDWSGMKNCSGSYINFNGNGGYSFNSSNFDKVYDEFVRNYRAVKLIEDNKIEDEKRFIETTKQSMYELSSKSLSELLNIYDKSEVLSKDVLSNDLLVFMVRRGYINERYVDYINYFKATTITTDDMNYILGIKNLSPKPFDYCLTRIDLVIDRLQQYEFEQEVVYNFNLLEFMLASDKYDNKLNLYIKQLSNGSNNSWTFIDEFIDITNQKERFIEKLADNWKNMWDSIYNNTVLTIDRKFFYLSLLILYSSVASIKFMDTNGNLTKFFIENRDALRRLSFIDDVKLIDVITALGIEFIDLEINDVSSNVLDYIFDNNFYSLNYEMIQHIVEHKNKELVPYLDTKNYSTILKLNYGPLLKRIEENIYTYTDNIILLWRNTKEEIHAIIKLLELNIGSKSRYIQIIGNEDFYVEDITEFCLNFWNENEAYVTAIWNVTITNGKLKPTWKNFYNYWYYVGHSDTSISYMCKNIDTLIKDTPTCINDESFIKELILFDVDSDSFEKILRELPWENFNIQLNMLNKDKISIMIRLRYFAFNVERYNELLTAFPELCVDYIIYNQAEYISVSEKIDMDSNLLKLLIFNNNFARSNVQYLMEVFGTEHMTREIAIKLNSIGITVNVELFDAAWKLLNNKEKEALMLSNLELLNAEKFEFCFSELGEEYKELSDRSRRHEVGLSDNHKNWSLVQRLKDVGYITSFQQKTYKDINKPKSNKTISKIVCRIKH